MAGSNDVRALFADLATCRQSRRKTRSYGTSMVCAQNGRAHERMLSHGMFAQRGRRHRNARWCTGNVIWWCTHVNLVPAGFECDVCSSVSGGDGACVSDIGAQRFFHLSQTPRNAFWTVPLHTFEEFQTKMRRICAGGAMKRVEKRESLRHGRRRAGTCDIEQTRRIHQRSRIPVPKCRGVNGL